MISSREKRYYFTIVGILVIILEIFVLVIAVVQKREGLIKYNRDDLYVQVADSKIVTKKSILTVQLSDITFLFAQAI